jgi:hypothetical protein
MRDRTAVGTSVVATPTSHHRQQSRASLRINGRDGQLLSRLIKGLRSKVSGSAPRCLYHGGKTESTVQDITRWARLFDFLTTRTMRHPVHYKRGPDPHVNNIYPTGATEQQGR